MSKSKDKGKEPGGQPMYGTPDELAEKVGEYFKGCGPQPIRLGDGTVLMDSKGQPVLRDEPPTMAGLALFLGFKSRQSLYDYRHRGEGFGGVIDLAKTTVEAHHERLLSVKDRCTGSIIWLKNFAEYKDERSLNGGLSLLSGQVGLSPEEEQTYRDNFKAFFGDKGAKR